MANIAIIIGSPNGGSRLYGLTEFAGERLAEAGLTLEWIAAADLPAEDLLRADFGSPAIKRIIASVEEADAVIIASPVFKAAYSGALKTILDVIP